MKNIIALPVAIVAFSVLTPVAPATAADPVPTNPSCVSQQDYNTLLNQFNQLSASSFERNKQLNDQILDLEYQHRADLATILDQDYTIRQQRFQISVLKAWNKQKTETIRYQRSVIRHLRHQLKGN